MEVTLALLPLVVALIMLAVLQRSGLQAGLATLATAGLVTLLSSTFRLSPDNLLLALGEGISSSLVVLYVLFPGLLLYRLEHLSGGLTLLSGAIARLSPDRSLQVLLLMMGLAPFVESVSGFGVGTVVAVPILVTLGVAPFTAALLGTLSQLAVPWGALAVGTALGAQLTGLNPNQLGQQTALLTAPLPVLYGLLALAISGGKAAVRRWWWVVGLAGATLAGGEYFFSQLPGIELAGALAAALTLILLGGLGRWLSTHAAPTAILAESPSPLRLWQALAPYFILTLLLLVSRLVPPLRLWLQNNVLLDIPTLKLRLPLLYSPGFWVLVTALIAGPILKLAPSDVKNAFGRTWQQFRPGAIAIASFLAAAQVMRDSGMTATLGVAAATLGSHYNLVAPWLGALGGWLTGSNTGSNAMFAPLQQETARRIGLPLDWLMAGQNGAGSHATMISPARTIMTVSAAGLPKSEGRLLRVAGPIVLLAVALITGLLALFSS